MSVGIYKITNNITGKEYVGQSNNILRRIREHKKSYGSKNCYVDRSIQKYGWENFSYTILHKCDLKDLDYYERYFIKKYDTYKNGYNLTEGGKNYSPLKDNHVRKKASETRCLRFNSTGFYRVSKTRRKDFKIGYCFTYKYRDDNGKSGLIQSANILLLKKKVLSKNYEWKILDETKAAHTLQTNIKDIEKYGWNKNCAKRSATGFYRVSRLKDSHMRQGFIYAYTYRVKGKVKRISNKSLKVLEHNVKNKGLVWKVENKELADECLKKEMDYT